MMETQLVRRHLIDTDGLSLEEMESLFCRAAYWRDHPEAWFQTGKGRFAANWFLEPSTRTRVSFEVAEKRLGMETIPLDGETSSTMKGESFYDTLRTLAAVGVEVVVVRHAGIGTLAEMAWENPGVSLVNAGEGNGGHPTQALLDLFTMREQFGTLKGLTVSIIGDIRHSRVARSNYWALKTFGARVILAGPESMRDPSLEEYAPYLPVDEAIRQADVVMMLRVQLERHRETLFSSPDVYLHAYGLTPERVEAMRSHAVILHPAPVNRGVEIASELVEHKRSKIFEQMSNGVWIRMAVLERALEGGRG
ncbi:aspartate carbamoyltransferase catalytic subunit [Desmospora profundinema]|uniref:Aspartate carbamoyltransferase n=1 Tax=Desmospora profundinema TaxID=1571184 RepID=A0ABU1IJQ3_9BACL|nr:aspartate carbamoyltransferase catalytic subunit [Desmospora profundinema]MDR6224767.1 aspartate carbamoyltransferase catalytic subunit [Desmospora profundinema]